MKRLTGYNSFGGVYGIGMGCGDNTDIIHDILKSLAYYEDLEEQGRLLVLPCKIGETIYQVKENCKCTAGHRYLHSTCNSPIECRICSAVKIESRIEETTFDLRLLDRIGKDFFLTREEAEKAIKEVEE